MNNENKNPNVEEELKKQSQEATENEQTTSEASEAQENASSEEKELTAEEKLGKELEEAQKVIDEQKDKYLRLSAEFDNFRKRTLKEKAELIQKRRRKGHQCYPADSGRLGTCTAEHAEGRRRESHLRGSGTDLSEVPEEPASGRLGKDGTCGRSIRY